MGEKKIFVPIDTLGTFISGYRNIYHAVSLLNDHWVLFWSWVIGHLLKTYDNVSLFY